jgi:hypothetical protein
MGFFRNLMLCGCHVINSCNDWMLCSHDLSNNVRSKYGKGGLIMLPALPGFEQPRARFRKN